MELIEVSERIAGSELLGFAEVLACALLLVNIPRFVSEKLAGFSGRFGRLSAHSFIT